MAQRRRKRSKKWISWLCFLILLIAAVVICYFVWEAYFKDKDGDYGKEEGNSSVTVPVEKQEEKVERKEERETVEKTEVKQYDGEDPNKSENLTGAMTYLGVSGSDLVARVNIDQYLTSGNCEIKVMKNGEVLYSEVVSVIDSAATSTCEGFNVPLGKLSTGKVQIEIKIEAGERTGVISGEVEI